MEILCAPPLWYKKEIILTNKSFLMKTLLIIYIYTVLKNVFLNAHVY